MRSSLVDNMDNIKQAIEFAKKNPGSQFAGELRKRIEEGRYTDQLRQAGLTQYIPDSQKGYGERIAEQYQAIGQRVTESLQKTGEGISEAQQKGDVLGTAGQMLRGGLRTVGAVAEGAFAPIVEAPVVKQALEFVGEKIADTKIAQKLQQKIQENPEKAQDIMDIVNTLTMGVGKAAEQPLLSGIKGAVKKTGQLAKDVVSGAKVQRVAELASQVDETVGKIVQGTEKDLARAKKALTDIDVSDITTYKDLGERIGEKIEVLSNKLDEQLGKFKTDKPITLENAVREIKVGEQVVRHNFVDDALTQLDDFYRSTNDVTGQTNINQLRNKFANEGITVKDINDLAKLHGEKLKGFNSKGELASGLTKQAAENTRAGVKATGREIFGGKVWGEIDSQISNLMRTKSLVDNVAKEVRKLEQKITKRGFGEEAGRLIFKVADIITGRGLSGFVQSFIPRGQGIKIMNALDLEKALNKNLKKLQEAINAPTESATIKQMENLINSIEDYTKNPKMGLGLEDVSKKASVAKTTETNLLTEAKKYKSAEEFVKAQLDKNSYVMSVNKKVYRGEGKGIGNSTLVDGQYFADSKEFASQFGDVSESVIPKGSKVFDLDKIKSGGGIIPDEMLVDNKALTKYLIDNGFDYTRNTNTRGVEFVKLNKISNELESLASKSQSLTDFKKKVMANYDKYRDELARISQNYTTADNSRLRSPIDDIYNKVENKGIPKTKSQLTEIWNKANKNVDIEPLIQEAKKYKSAEEFVKKQELIYHGADPRNIDALNKNGVKILSPEEKLKLPSTGGGNYGISMTTDKATAQNYSQALGNKNIGEFYINPNAKVKTISGYIDDIYTPAELEKLAKIYDVIKSTASESEVRILTNNGAVTKSQLTEIWNKANKK
jgi:hypothetical protein